MLYFIIPHPGNSAITFGNSFTRYAFTPGLCPSGCFWIPACAGMDWTGNDPHPGKETKSPPEHPRVFSGELMLYLMMPEPLRMQSLVLYQQFIPTFLVGFIGLAGVYRAHLGTFG